MTDIAKENIIRKIKGSTLFDDFDGAEDYLISLIREDMRKIEEKNHKSAEEWLNGIVKGKNNEEKPLCRCNEDGIHYVCSKCGRSHRNELEATLCCMEID